MGIKSEMKKDKKHITPQQAHFLQRMNEGTFSIDLKLDKTEYHLKDSFKAELKVTSSEDAYIEGVTVMHIGKTPDGIYKKTVDIVPEGEVSKGEVIKVKFEGTIPENILVSPDYPFLLKVNILYDGGFLDSFENAVFLTP